MQLDTIAVLGQCLPSRNKYQSDLLYKRSGLPHNALHLLVINTTGVVFLFACRLIRRQLFIGSSLNKPLH